MSPQKYKIYANGKPVFLTDPKGAADLGYQAGKNVHVTLYIGKRKIIKNYLDLLDKNPDVAVVVLYSPNLQGLWEDFQRCFTVLEAAGGYVLSPEGNLLVFYRRGSWDLPKGKIDPGETPEEAAVREVKEETGLAQVELGDFITHTYHTYHLKGARILKKTWWYKMKTSDTAVVPQVEEDIETINWVDPAAWLATEPEVYGSIREVIEMV